MAHGRRARAHAEGGHENSERWLITYADLITLLMVFFVVLYSMSKADTEKFQRISLSLEKAFNVDVLTATDAVSAGGDQSGALVVSMSQESTGASDAVVAEASRIRAQLETITTEGPAPDVAVIATKEGVVVRISGSFLFDSGRAELKPAAIPILDQLSKDLRGMSNDVRVDGHTDNIPVDSPRYATNWELSTARAVTVARFLAEIGQVPASRLGATGYGEFHPLGPNDTREQRALNRRVEIRILSGSTAGAPSGVAPSLESPPSLFGEPS